ncbi:unnamed protein product [Dibothriocephalus latus]|uniref:Uncharacterized protein n=1 Tax=Dibothriocephalus latus TaxID=60516 RepID=A0A3P7NUN9_DIBLA|nr:unnamed protein product [Dibothriocephalus latus]
MVFGDYGRLPSDDQLVGTLASVDAFFQLFPMLERNVADLDAMVTKLETTVDELCARQKAPQQRQSTT